jgi:hypothetical protein
MRLNNWSIAASYDTARIFAGLGFGSPTASRDLGLSAGPHCSTHNVCHWRSRFLGSGVF